MIKHDGKDIFTNGSTVSKDVNTDTLKNDNYHGPWEFFKDIHGIISRPMNEQINIPSTAFTPNFSMPSKAILNNIVLAKNFLESLLKKINDVSNVFSNNSNYVKQNKIVKLSIAKAYDKFKEGVK